MTISENTTRTTSPVYTYDKSNAMFDRAVAVIPGGIYGHLGPSEGCYIPRSAYPLFSARAEGTRFWDLDGNEFIDYMCGYGPNVLGYNDPVVAAAAERQARYEDVVSIPGATMVEFAELLTDTVDCADWAFFAKNGGDVTTLAVMTARAATARQRIVFFEGYYHGVDPWAQKLDYPGVLEQDVLGNIEAKWNDIADLRRIFSENRGEIAALIAQPYKHGNFVDNELPAQGYWQQVRALCDEHGVVLIVDDVRAGWRLDLAGSDHFYGFKADLITFCKALANGYNVSALCGIDALRESVSSITYTGSYWMSAVPFAAAIATIKRLKEIDGPSMFRRLGTELTDGLVDLAATHGHRLIASGEPALFYLRLADDDSLDLHQRWIAECVRRGVFLTSHHNHFINAALTSADITRTLEIADDAFVAIRNG